MTGVAPPISDRPSLAARLDDCAPACRELHRRVLRSFLSGHAPQGTDLDRWARELAIELPLAVAELERRDALWLDREDGSVAVAYPFSGAPTAHGVTVAGSGVPVFAMCAIDALGVAFMVGEPVIVRSSDPGTAEPIEVRIDPAGKAAWKPAGAGVVCVSSGNGPSATCRCPNINFVADHARASALVDGAGWAARAVLEMPQAIERGRRIFGSLLQPVQGA